MSYGQNAPSPSSFSGGYEKKFDLGTWIQEQFYPAILQAGKEGNFNHYFWLVELLDITLTPSHDDTHTADTKTLNAWKKEQEAKFKQDSQQWKDAEFRYFKSWHRLLMELCSRKNLMRQEHETLDIT